MKMARLANIFRNEIAEILRKKINDPRIGFVSIMEVKISSDLKYAKVYYSQLGNESDKKKTLKALRRAESFIKYEVGKVINLRVMPDIIFEYDDSLEKGTNILNKIEQLNEQK